MHFAKLMSRGKRHSELRSSSHEVISPQLREEQEIDARYDGTLGPSAQNSFARLAEESSQTKNMLRGALRKLLVKNANRVWRVRNARDNRGSSAGRALEISASKDEQRKAFSASKTDSERDVFREKELETERYFYELSRLPQECQQSRIADGMEIPGFESESRKVLSLRDVNWKHDSEGKNETGKERYPFEQSTPKSSAAEPDGSFEVDGALSMSPEDTETASSRVPQCKTKDLGAFSESHAAFVFDTSRSNVGYEGDSNRQQSVQSSRVHERHRKEIQHRISKGGKVSESVTQEKFGRCGRMATWESQLCMEIGAVAHSASETETGEECTSNSRHAMNPNQKAISEGVDTCPEAKTASPVDKKKFSAGQGQVLNCRQRLIFSRRDKNQMREIEKTLYDGKKLSAIVREKVLGGHWKIVRSTSRVYYLVIPFELSALESQTEARDLRKIRRDRRGSRQVVAASSDSADDVRGECVQAPHVDAALRDDSRNQNRAGPPLSQMAKISELRRLAIVRRRGEIAAAQEAALREGRKIPRRAIAFPKELWFEAGSRSNLIGASETTPRVSAYESCLLKKQVTPGVSFPCSWTTCSNERAILAKRAVDAARSCLQSAPPIGSLRSHVRHQAQTLRGKRSLSRPSQAVELCPYLARRLKVSERHVRFRVAELC